MVLGAIARFDTQSRDRTTQFFCAILPGCHKTFMNRQDACSTFMNRQDACSTKSEFSCGTGILPVADNVARSQE